MRHWTWGERLIVLLEVFFLGAIIAFHLLNAPVLPAR
jgi:hypothetical protein